MINSPHFFGFSRLGAELTKGAVDQREQFDFGTRHECTWKPGDPEYLKLWGNAQWPPEEFIPGFKETYLEYLEQVSTLSYEFAQLLGEALGLDRDALAQFFDRREHMQHRSKIVKYPTRDQISSDQGVGPHFDAGFLTFLVQASSHRGLQVQNLAGDWIDAPPIKDTFVVNIGKGLETVTRGLAKATSHRVLAPEPGSGPRYSIPFFQNIGQNVKLGEHILNFPEEVMKLKESRGQEGATDSVNHSEYGFEPSGQVSLIGRIKSHPDVAQRHYPELFKKYFPEGLPTVGTAY